MTLDSSALIAMLFAEPGYLDLVDRILGRDKVRCRRPRSWKRAWYSPAGASFKAVEVEALVKELGVTVVPFGEPSGTQPSRRSSATAAAAIRPH